MGKLEGIDDKLRTFIAAQHMFFVATAPLGAEGHVNVSPKGLDTFRVLGPRRVAYLDYVGSGTETIAHLLENGRITLMFCAFQGPPTIVRLHGAGRVLKPGQSDFDTVRPLLPPPGRSSLSPPAAGERSIIDVAVDRVSDSCGFGVPLYDFQGHRTQLSAWCDRKGADGLRTYQIDRNAVSIDHLPAVDWVKVS